MKNPLSRQKIFRCGVLLAFFSAYVLGAPAPSEIDEKKTSLYELRNQITSLQKELAESESSKTSVADKLYLSKQKVRRLEKNLENLGKQRGDLKKQVQNLEIARQKNAKVIEEQQRRLEKLLYQHYVRGNPDNFQLLLNGDDPAQISRDVYYLSAIAKSRANLLANIKNTLEKQKELSEKLRNRQDALQVIEGEQQEDHRALAKERATQAALFHEISNKVKVQKDALTALQEDEKRMSMLILRLSKILAEEAAKAEKVAKAEKARRDEMLRQTKEKKDTSITPSEVENRYDPVASQGSFSGQKGHLRLPVKGTVTGFFGKPRDGGAVWRGIFIQAKAGSEVKAIANGRVVFADTLRGFGKLIILDHGNAYLSIYGYNDSLESQVGDSVKGGDRIARTGQNEAESGLYFELRHKGQPLNPMLWTQLK